MILTHSFVVGGKGYKSGVSNQGKAWQLQSFKAFPFDEYVSVMLPEFVHEGMTVTVSGTVKKKEDGQYTNYNLQFPTIDTIYQPDPQAQQAAPQNPIGDADPFAGGRPMEISDDDLPF